MHLYIKLYTLYIVTEAVTSIISSVSWEDYMLIAAKQCSTGSSTDNKGTMS